MVYMALYNCKYTQKENRSTAMDGRMIRKNAISVNRRSEQTLHPVLSVLQMPKNLSVKMIDSGSPNNKLDHMFFSDYVLVYLL